MRNKKSFFKKARKEKWAIGQFNFSTLEILKAIFEAASNLRSPIIVATSFGESNYFGLEEAALMVRFFEKKYKIPAFLNLDHAKDLSYIKKAIKAGYDYIHFDGSELPFRENIKKTKEVVRLAKKNGIVVEGELGIIGGSSKSLESAPSIERMNFTDPEKALIFVKETGVDLLAVSIGNYHGMVKGRENRSLRIDILKKIKNLMKDKVFLVLHGGSGISPKAVKKAIENGVVKVNINTELRMAFSGSLREVLSQTEEIVPYKFMPKSILAVKKVVEKKIKLFGSDNKI